MWKTGVTIKKEKKFFINNSVQALIPFKKGHWSLWKLYVHLWEGALVWEKGKNFL